MCMSHDCGGGYDTGCPLKCTQGLPFRFLGNCAAIMGIIQSIIWIGLASIVLKYADRIPAYNEFEDLFAPNNNSREASDAGKSLNGSRKLLDTNLNGSDFPRHEKTVFKENSELDDKIIYYIRDTQEPLGILAKDYAPSPEPVPRLQKTPAVKYNWRKSRLRNRNGTVGLEKNSGSVLERYGEADRRSMAEKIPDIEVGIMANGPTSTDAETSGPETDWWSIFEKEFQSEVVKMANEADSTGSIVLQNPKSTSKMPTFQLAKMDPKPTSGLIAESLTRSNTFSVVTKETSQKVSTAKVITESPEKTQQIQEASTEPSNKSQGMASSPMSVKHKGTLVPLEITSKVSSELTTSPKVSQNPNSWTSPPLAEFSRNPSSLTTASSTTMPSSRMAKIIPNPRSHTLPLLEEVSQNPNFLTSSQLARISLDQSASTLPQLPKISQNPIQNLEESTFTDRVLAQLWRTSKGTTSPEETLFVQPEKIFPPKTTTRPPTLKLEVHPKTLELLTSSSTISSVSSSLEDSNFPEELSTGKPVDITTIKVLDLYQKLIERYYQKPTPLKISLDDQKLTTDKFLEKMETRFLEKLETKFLEKLDTTRRIEKDLENLEMEKWGLKNDEIRLPTNRFPTTDLYFPKKQSFAFSINSRNGSQDFTSGRRKKFKFYAQTYTIDDPFEEILISTKRRSFKKFEDLFFTEVFSPFHPTVKKKIPTQIPLSTSKKFGRPLSQKPSKPDSAYRQKILDFLFNSMENDQEPRHSTSRNLETTRPSNAEIKIATDSPYRKNAWKFLFNYNGNTTPIEEQNRPYIKLNWKDPGQMITVTPKKLTLEEEKNALLEQFDKILFNLKPEESKIEEKILIPKIAENSANNPDDETVDFLFYDDEFGSSAPNKFFEKIDDIFEEPTLAERNLRNQHLQKKLKRDSEPKIGYKLTPLNESKRSILQLYEKLMESSTEIPKLETTLVPFLKVKSKAVEELANIGVILQTSKKTTISQKPKNWIQELLEKLPSIVVPNFSLEQTTGEEKWTARTKPMDDIFGDKIPKSTNSRFRFSDIFDFGTRKSLTTTGNPSGKKVEPKSDHMFWTPKISTTATVPEKISFTPTPQTFTTRVITQKWTKMATKMKLDDIFAGPIRFKSAKFSSNPRSLTPSFKTTAITGTTEVTTETSTPRSSTDIEILSTTSTSVEISSTTSTSSEIPITSTETSTTSTTSTSTTQTIPTTTRSTTTSTPTSGTVSLQVENFIYELTHVGTNETLSTTGTPETILEKLQMPLTTRKPDGNMVLEKIFTLTSLPPKNENQEIFPKVYVTSNFFPSRNHNHTKKAKNVMRITKKSSPKSSETTSGHTKSENVIKKLYNLIEKGYSSTIFADDIGTTKFPFQFRKHTLESSSWFSHYSVFIGFHGNGQTSSENTIKIETSSKICTTEEPVLEIEAPIEVTYAKNVSILNETVQPLLVEGFSGSKDAIENSKDTDPGMKYFFEHFTKSDEPPKFPVFAAIYIPLMCLWLFSSIALCIILHSRCLFRCCPIIALIGYFIWAVITFTICILDFLLTFYVLRDGFDTLLKTEMPPKPAEKKSRETENIIEFERIDVENSESAVLRKILQSDEIDSSEYDFSKKDYTVRQVIAHTTFVVAMFTWRFVIFWLLNLLCSVLLMAALCMRRATCYCAQKCPYTINCSGGFPQFSKGTLPPCEPNICRPRSMMSCCRRSCGGGLVNEEGSDYKKEKIKSLEAPIHYLQKSRRKRSPSPPYLEEICRKNSSYERYESEDYDHTISAHTNISSHIIDELLPRRKKYSRNFEKHAPGFHSKHLETPNGSDSGGPYQRPRQSSCRCRKNNAECKCNNCRNPNEHSKECKKVEGYMEPFEECLERLQKNSARSRRRVKEHPSFNRSLEGTSKFDLGSSRSHRRTGFENLPKPCRKRSGYSSDSSSPGENPGNLARNRTHVDYPSKYYRNPEFTVGSHRTFSSKSHRRDYPSRLYRNPEFSTKKFPLSVEFPSEASTLRHLTFDSEVSTIGKPMQIEQDFAPTAPPYSAVNLASNSNRMIDKSLYQNCKNCGKNFDASATSSSKNSALICNDCYRLLACAETFHDPPAEFPDTNTQVSTKTPKTLSSKTAILFDHKHKPCLSCQVDKLPCQHPNFSCDTCQKDVTSVKPEVTDPTTTLKTDTTNKSTLDSSYQAIYMSHRLNNRGFKALRKIFNHDEVL